MSLIGTVAVRWPRLGR